MEAKLLRYVNKVQYERDISGGEICSAAELCNDRFSREVEVLNGQSGIRFWNKATWLVARQKHFLYSLLAKNKKIIETITSFVCKVTNTLYCLWRLRSQKETLIRLKKMAGSTFASLQFKMWVAKEVRSHHLLLCEQ